MLSTDDASPSLDLSCSCFSSQLIQSSDSTNTCGDEKASSHVNNQVKIDLSDSGFDDNVKPISNFSIRDYVFSTRDKDFKTHWPFSLKKLQLCLRHEVKNVLPPFETLESVRNHSILRIPVEKSSSNINPDHLKISCSSDNLSTVSSSNDRQKIVASNLEYINSIIATEEDKEYRSTTTSQSCSDDICSIPASNKVATSNTHKKKCNLVVKLSSFAEPKSTKEVVKTPVIVDTMANSKVCPVCKTFSSSSNTTLNVHIDQCLSGGPTSNCMASSKVIKHRIKPRKTRMMVDIYATALHCTLEDLDRRNGTNWASGSGPAQCLEANPSIRAKDINDEKNDAFSSVKVADKDVEGAVYVDSTGTKLRILSKFNDLPSNGNAVDDSSTVKLVKGDQINKFLSSKKKKCLPQNHKLLKSSSHDKNPDHSHKITDGEQRYVSSKKGCKNLDLKQHFDPCDLVRSGNFGLVKQWVGSKRTLLKKKKKNNLEHENHRTSKAVKSLRVKTTQSEQRDNLVKETNDSCSPLPGKIPLLSAESRKRKNMSFHSHDEQIEQPRMRKRKELNYHAKKSHVVHSMSKDPEKNDSSVLERLEDPRNGTEDHVSSSGDKGIGINVRSRLKADVSFTRSRMPMHPKFSPGNKDLRSSKNSSSDHKILFRSENFSSFNTNMPSVKRSPASESKKLGVDLRKRKLRYVSESDEEPIVMFRSDDGRKYNMVETSGENASQREGLSNKSSDNGFNKNLLKVQKNRLEHVNSRKDGGDLVSQGLINPLRYNNRSIGRVTESCVDGDNIAAGTSDAYDVVKEVQNHEERTCEPKDCTLVEGETFMAIDRSPDSALPLHTEFVPQHYAKEGEEITQPGLVLHDNEETIPRDNGNDLVIPNYNEDVGIDANEGHGNYYVDIDPIPIPGPPGSFLPSPRHMGSDELQGKSSLTTSGIHSSEDEHEVVGMNSSDSPISATSIISNSIADGSKSAFSMDRSIQTSGVQDNTQSDDALEAKIGGVVENFTRFEPDAGPERKEEFDGSRTNLTSPHSFNNSQPCCGFKKEGVFQTSESGYQESQLLKRRNMNFIPLFPVNKPVSEHKKVEECSSILHGNGLVSYSYDETLSPSTPNPVFRLMGKNLMVVNQEEDLSPQTRSIQAIANEHHHVLQGSNSDFSKANSHNLQYSSFNNILDQGPSMLDNTQRFNPAQNIGFGSSEGLRMNDGFRNRELFSQGSFNGNHASSFEGRVYSGGFSTTNPDQTNSNIEINVPRIYAAEKVQTRVPTRPKEVIVIDDSTEHDGMNLSDNSSALRRETRNANTFYICQTQNYPIYNGTQRVHNMYTQVPYSIGIHKNVEKWNYSTPRSSSMLNPNSFTASSSISGQPRSSLYFSSGIPLHKNFS